MEFHQQRINGLSDSEVKERIASGLVNRQIGNQSQSAKAIVRNNVFTFFNLINLILFIALILVGSFKTECKYTKTFFIRKYFFKNIFN